ncbi:MAG: ParB N-terminal domain-containing protein [Rhizobiales bacterium]|nr:ParB N-terminal domain-containing protein [Hyphomicrobiales bacterium]
MSITQPQYQLLKPLRPEDYAALRESIAEIGVQQPVIFDEDGAVLDGHHRLEVCRELGFKTFPKMIKYGLSEVEKHEYVRALNIARRHMSRIERRAFLRDVLIETTTATSSLSDRAIAARLAVDHKTVGLARAKMVRRGEIPHVKTRTDTLGRSQPAERQRAVYVESGEESSFSERSGGARPAGPLDPSPTLRSSDGDTENSDKATNGGAAIGTKSASRQERGDDLYETPRCAIVALLAVETFSSVVLEPACGRGAISQVLEEKGYEVGLSDLRDYGTADSNGVVQETGDFLTSMAEERTQPDIITNPPFGIINQFIAHALREHGPQKVAMLCNLNVLAGADNPDRNFWMDEHPPARIHVFSRRLPMMHRDGFEGEKSGSQMNCVWLVWERPHDGTFPTEPPQLFRHDWKKIMAAAGEGDWRPDE